jgi:hypothetical protein
MSPDDIAAAIKTHLATQPAPDTDTGGATPAAPAPKQTGDGTFLTQGNSKPLRSTIDDPAYAAPNLTIARASLAPDVNDQIKRYADYFGIDPKYFGVVNGEIVRWVPEQNAYAKVVPTIGGGTGFADKAERALPYTASGFGPALPGIGGGIAGAVSGPGPQSIGAAGMGAFATDLGRQWLDRLLAGETQPGQFNLDLKNSFGQGLLAAGGQALGVGVNRLLTTNPLGVDAFDRAAALDPVRRQAAVDLANDARARGIDLSTGQATGLRSIMATERQLGKFPETTDQVYDFTGNQRNTQVPMAFRSELDNISPVAGREAQISAFRNGAENVVQGALDARNMAAARAYSTALDRPDRFWVPALDDLMARPSMQDAIARATTLAKEEGKDITVPVFDKGTMVGRDVVPDWRSWDYIKRGLDSIVQDNTDQFGRVNAYGRAVAGTRKALLGYLDAANPDYKTARALYGSASDAVSGVLDGGVGMLQGMSGPDRQGVVSRIFSGGNLLPEEVTRMRNQFAMTGHLDDWNAGLRGFLEGRLDDAMKGLVTGGDVGNVPGKLYAGLWGDPAQRKMMEAALGDPARVASMDRLMDIFRAASRVLPEGSPTATDTGAGTDAVGKGLRFLGKMFSMQTYMNPGDKIIEGINVLRTPAARMQLADYLLSPRGMSEMAKFRMLAPNTQRALGAAGDLLVNAGIIASGARNPRDFPAPAAPIPSGPL